MLIAVQYEEGDNRDMSSTGGSFWKERSIYYAMASGFGIGIIFVALQLSDVTKWSWWAASAPFWSVALYCVLAAIVYTLTPNKNAYTLSNWSGAISAVNMSITFAVLRLLNVTDWSWWGVTAPVWAGAIVALIIFLVSAASGATRK